MTRHRSKLLVLALLALSLFGCAEEKQAGDKAGADVKNAAKAKKDPAEGKAAAKGKQAKVQTEEEPAPALSVPEGFKYEPQGRRDPFVNPIPKPPPPAPLIPTERPEGLAGVLVAEAQIKGIITSREPGMTKVIISGPGSPQRKTYYANKGDTLFDAVIKEIRSNEVVFTMISPTTKQPVNREMTVKTGNSGAPAGDKK
jgi:hypothetical protein